MLAEEGSHVLAAARSMDKLKEIKTETELIEAMYEGLGGGKSMAGGPRVREDGGRPRGRDSDCGGFVGEGAGAFGKHLVGDFGGDLFRGTDCGLLQFGDLGDDVKPAGDGRGCGVH